jgi:hypothetical protein
VEQSSNWSKPKIGVTTQFMQKHIAHGAFYELSCSNLDLIELGFQY